MTPAAWIDAIQKVIVLIGMIFVVWWIWHSGGNQVKIEDIQSVQKQNKDIAKSLSEWIVQDSKAKADRDATIKTLSDRIDKQREPIIVRVPATTPRAFTLPGVSTSRDTSGSPPAGGSSTGSGGSREENLRPEFNRIEMKYSKALAECRQIIATCKIPK